MSDSWNPCELVPAETPIVVLAEGCFGESQSKFALGVMRYGQWPVAAVIDSTRTGKSVRELTGLDCDAPIAGNLEAALPFKPKALLIGTAPAGGQLPSEWRDVLASAIRNGLHIINGLHFFLGEEADLVALAEKHGVRLWDVRDPEAYGRHKFQVINYQKPRPDNLKVITMVGTDCSVGKMHTALELDRGSRERSFFSSFIATGQTGILIAGRGVPLDRVIGDFMAGAMEICIQEEIQRLGLGDRKTALPGTSGGNGRTGSIETNNGNRKTISEMHKGAKQDAGAPSPHLLFVEGQGSLMHPAYSGVTLSLLHGSNPDALVLCHKADTLAIRNYPQIPLPPLPEIVAMYEEAARWVRPQGQPSARMAGISVNTSMLAESEARRYLDNLAAETGLPATDPVRYGVENLLSALEQALGLRQEITT